MKEKFEAVNLRRTIQWQKKKEQKDKQRFTKHYTKKLRSRDTKFIKKGMNSYAPER